MLAFRCESVETWHALRLFYRFGAYPYGTRAQGKHSEAVPLLERALAAMQETHGADNQSTAVTLRRLLEHAQAQVRSRETARSAFSVYKSR